MPGDARGSVCVAAICRYTSLVYSVVQEYGAAARRRHSKWRHDSAPMNQNSTAAHRPAAPLSVGPVKPCCLHIIQIEILTVTPPVILTMKIRHLNPRQMVSIPEQRVTVRHPVLKAPPGEMRHTAEFMNRPRQTSHHGKSLCTCSRRSASLSRGRPPGWLWTSATISPCISACSQSSGDIRKYASGSPEIFTQGKYLSPSGVLTTKPHDSAGAHRRACARIADSVCVMGFTAKVC